MYRHKFNIARYLTNLSVKESLKCCELLILLFTVIAQLFILCHRYNNDMQYFPTLVLRTRKKSQSNIINLK